MFWKSFNKEDFCYSGLIESTRIEEFGVLKRCRANGWHYEIEDPLYVVGCAPEKHANLSLAELWAGGRLLFGMLGNLRFYGYSVDADEGLTTLINPILITTYPDLDSIEAHDIAENILQRAYATQGVSALINKNFVEF